MLDLISGASDPLRHRGTIKTVDGCAGCTSKKSINDIPNHPNYYVIYIYIFTIYKCGHAQHNTAWWAAGWFKQAKPELKLGPSTEIVISNSGCLRHFNI